MAKPHGWWLYVWESSQDYVTFQVGDLRAVMSTRPAKYPRLCWQVTRHTTILVEFSILRVMDLKVFLCDLSPFSKKRSKTCFQLLKDFCVPTWCTHTLTKTFPTYGAYDFFLSWSFLVSKNNPCKPETRRLYRCDRPIVVSYRAFTGGEAVQSCEKNWRFDQWLVTGLLHLLINGIYIYVY